MITSPFFVLSQQFGSVSLETGVTETEYAACVLLIRKKPQCTAPGVLSSGIKIANLSGWVEKNKPLILYAEELTIYVITRWVSVQDYQLLLSSVRGIQIVFIFHQIINSVIILNEN